MTKQCGSCNLWAYSYADSMIDGSPVRVGYCSLLNEYHCDWFICLDFNRGCPNNNDLKEEDNE